MRKVSVLTSADEIIQGFKPYRHQNDESVSIPPDLELEITIDGDLRLSGTGAIYFQIENVTFENLIDAMLEELHIRVRSPREQKTA